MARQIHSRLKIIGELIAETPLHVGGYGESFETDMALARNGRDEFYIPGTSLTGSLRNWFAKNFPAEVKKLWGYQDDNNGHASFVLVEDLQLPAELQSAVQSELRDGVGIDRFYGTAADKAKFDRTILPKGTKLDFEMTVEIASRKLKSKEKQKNEDDKYAESEEEFDARIAKTKAMFLLLLDALQNQSIRLGAAKTRGLGKVKLSATQLKEDLLATFDILKALEDKKDAWLAFDNFLKKDENKNAKKIYDGLRDHLSKQLSITINWQPKSPLMVKAGYEGIGVDMLPLTSGNGKDKVSLVLPGSSIKGAFRAHAERILRTLLFCEDKTKPNCDDRNEKLKTKGKEFHDQIKLDIIKELFGAKKEKDGQANHLGLGALNIDDCYAKKEFLMGVDDWQKVETGKVTKTEKYNDNGKEKDREVEVTHTDQELWQALKKIDNDNKDDTTNFKISHHVAIDRWTGGAAEGALYSVLQPIAKSGWEEICLTLDVSRLPDESLRKRCLMLLLLILRDFAENRLPLGFATNRGMGEVKDVSFKTQGLYEIEWKDGKFDFMKCANLKTELETEWKKWLEQN